MSAASEWNPESLAARAGLVCVWLHEQLPSTNTEAARILEVPGERPPLPAAVLARRQTAGRGRGQNSWYSDEVGSLTVTYLLETDPHRPGWELPLRSGLAVARAVADLAGLPLGPAGVAVKWPNDVWADGRKLAGLLCERRRGCDLIGVGVNVGADMSRAPAEVRRRAVSLHELCPPLSATPTVPTVMAAVAAELIRLAKLAPETLLEQFNLAHGLTGQPVTVEWTQPDGETRRVAGTVLEVDADGRLVLLDADGRSRHRLLDGTVRLAETAASLMVPRAPDTPAE